MEHIYGELERLRIRVAKLEARNRRWKLAAVLLALCGIPLGVISAKSAQRMELPVVRARVVETEDFLLKDDSGHVYARLTSNPDRTSRKGLRVRKPSPAVLEFYDEDGNLAFTVPAPGGLVPVK